MEKENPLDAISIAVISIASENEDDTNTNAAPHHCMPTLCDASGSLFDTLDTILEDIVQKRIPTRELVSRVYLRMIHLQPNVPRYPGTRG